jgi:hypothetical protein
VIAIRDFEFTCVCGEPAIAPKLTESDWAILAGYGDMHVLQWYETKELARTKSDFETLETCPVIGQSYWLALNFPFASVLGESFWCIHEPPLFHINGIDEDTDIRQFSFVRCHLTEMEITQQDARKDDGSWLSTKAGVARATVEAVMTLDDVLALPLSETAADDLLWCNLRFSGHTTVIRQGSLIHAVCATNVDWTSWAILHNTPESTDLLVFSNFSDHDDDVRVGRTRLRHGSTMIGPGVPLEWLEAGASHLYFKREI